MEGRLSRFVWRGDLWNSCDLKVRATWLLTPSQWSEFNGASEYFVKWVLNLKYGQPVVDVINLQDTSLHCERSAWLNTGSNALIVTWGKSISTSFIYAYLSRMVSEDVNPFFFFFLKGTSAKMEASMKPKPALKKSRKEMRKKENKEDGKKKYFLGIETCMQKRRGET